MDRDDRKKAEVQLLLAVPTRFIPERSPLTVGEQIEAERIERDRRRREVERLQAELEGKDI